MLGGLPLRFNWIPRGNVKVSDVWDLGQLAILSASEYPSHAHNVERTLSQTMLTGRPLLCECVSCYLLQLCTCRNECAVQNGHPDLDCPPEEVVVHIDCLGRASCVCEPKVDDSSTQVAGDFLRPVEMCSLLTMPTGHCIIQIQNSDSIERASGVCKAITEFLPHRWVESRVGPMKGCS